MDYFGIVFALYAGSELRGTQLNFVELRIYELRRIPLPRTPVNRAVASLPARPSEPSRGVATRRRGRAASSPLPPQPGRRLLRRDLSRRVAGQRRLPGSYPALLRYSDALRGVTQ